MQKNLKKKNWNWKQFANLEIWKKNGKLEIWKFKKLEIDNWRKTFTKIYY